MLWISFFNSSSNLQCLWSWSFLHCRNNALVLIGLLLFGVFAHNDPDITWPSSQQIGSYGIMGLMTNVTEVSPVNNIVLRWARYDPIFWLRSDQRVWFHLIASDLLEIFDPTKYFDWDQIKGSDSILLPRIFSRSSVLLVSKPIFWLRLVQYEKFELVFFPRIGWKSNLNTRRA